jgi:hypothetical protein
MSEPKPPALPADDEGVVEGLARELGDVFVLAFNEADEDTWQVVARFVLNLKQEARAEALSVAAAYCEAAAVDARLNDLSGGYALTSAANAIRALGRPGDEGETG